MGCGDDKKLLSVKIFFWSLSGALPGEAKNEYLRVVFFPRIHNGIVGYSLSPVILLTMVV